MFNNGKHLHLRWFALQCSDKISLIEKVPPTRKKLVSLRPFLYHPRYGMMSNRWRYSVDGFLDCERPKSQYNLSVFIKASNFSQFFTDDLEEVQGTEKNHRIKKVFELETFVLCKSYFIVCR